MRKFSKLLFIAVLLAVMLILGQKLWDRMQFSKNTYYGVFLTNGQVYFGKMKHKDRATITLTDVYYLQANQPLPTDGTVSQEAIDLQVALIKLGDEIHGPEDLMHIERSHVIFYEPLRSDGKVVEAIHSYQP